MTNIIDMAREAGSIDSPDVIETTYAAFRAAIIAELCAGVEMPEPVGACVDDTGYAYIKWRDGTRLLVGATLFTLDQMREAVASAVVKEREECAYLCDQLFNHAFDASECADNIRARSDKL